MGCFKALGEKLCHKMQDTDDPQKEELPPQPHPPLTLLAACALQAEKD